MLPALSAAGSARLRDFVESNVASSRHRIALDSGNRYGVRWRDTRDRRERAVSNSGRLGGVFPSR